MTPGALCCRSGTSPDPHGCPKNTLSVRDSLCCYGNRFKVFAGLMLELWMFVFGIAVLLVGLAAIVLWGAFR